MFLIFSIFSLVTNINIFNQANGTGVMCIITNALAGGCGLSPLGAGSKVLNQSSTSIRYSQVESWISVAFVSLWGLLYIAKTISE